MQSFIHSLCTTEIFTVFLIGTLGYLLGSIKVKGIEVGAAGVLIVALAFGHFSSKVGFSVPPFVSTVGTVLFVGSVGFIAGPSFFRNFKQNAKSYVLLGFVVILTGAVTCAMVVKFAGIPSPLAAGIFTGALTSTPGLAAATEAAASISTEAANMVAVGYGVAYPFGVIGVVLFVQLLPKVLKVDMKEERRQIMGAESVGTRKREASLLQIDPLGIFPFCLAITVGVIIGKINIPLPGGARFSLGTTGGPLISGLIFAHFGRVGKISLSIDKAVLNAFRELGLCLFLIGAGFKGGNGFAEILREYGFSLFIYGVLMTLIPMIFGFIMAGYVLKLCLLNNLGAICGGMTSTPALGTLIKTAGTENVAASYAATYPIALVCVVLCSQFIVLLLN